MSRKVMRRVALLERRIAHLDARQGGDRDRAEAAALRWAVLVVGAAIECGCHELLIEEPSTALRTPETGS